MIAKGSPPPQNEAAEPDSVLRRTFKAFEYRDFRLMWTGACTSTIGTWMQIAAQSWLVYEISNNNARFLALDSFLGQIPIFLFSLLGGVVADRRNRRNMLLVSQYIQMGCAFALASLVFTDVVAVWQIWCLSFVVGTAQSFGGPAYQALLPTLVDRKDLANAIAMNSAQFNLARLIGPSLGGLALIQLGAAWCFTINGTSFLAVIATLYMIHVGFVPARSTEPMLESMKQGIKFIRARPGMEPLILLAFLITLLGLPLNQLLPVFAKEVFHGGAGTFTLFLVCSGAGSVCGSLVVAWLGRLKHPGQIALLILIALGVLIIGFALSPWLPLSYVLLFLSGGLLIAVFNTVASLVQLITEDSMRGRVMSVYNVAFRGGGPIGVLIAGSVIPRFGAPATFAVMGTLLIGLALYFLFLNRQIAKL
jgi:predicted MFS family arabinose efflux permease